MNFHLFSKGNKEIAKNHEKKTTTIQRKGSQFNSEHRSTLEMVYPVIMLHLLGHVCVLSITWIMSTWRVTINMFAQVLPKRMEKLGILSIN